MTDTPETDEHGFAPTKIVRVQRSRGGGALRFFRVWMKPDDLAFPAQHRSLTEEEEPVYRARYARRIMAGERFDGDVTVRTAGPDGGMPPNETPERPGGDSGRKFLNPQEKGRVEIRGLRWRCPDCAREGLLRAFADESMSTIHERAQDEHRSRMEYVGGFRACPCLYRGEMTLDDSVIEQIFHSAEEDDAEAVSLAAKSAGAIDETFRSDAAYEEALAMAAKSPEVPIFAAAYASPHTPIFNAGGVHSPQGSEGVLSSPLDCSPGSTSNAGGKRLS